MKNKVTLKVGTNAVNKLSLYISIDFICKDAEAIEWKYNKIGRLYDHVFEFQISASSHPS